MIDEAQLLPPETLEFLRLLSNFETDREKLIQTVLVGQPELDNTLARRDMRQVNQRVALRARLAPLGLTESIELYRASPPGERRRGSDPDPVADRGLAHRRGGPRHPARDQHPRRQRADRRARPPGSSRSALGSPTMRSATSSTNPGRRARSTRAADCGAAAAANSAGCHANDAGSAAAAGFAR